MHDLGYNAIHDEIVVTSPLTQAILTFRGGASGEEAPIRIIQGGETGIIGVGATGKVTIDPENNEIFLATPKQTIQVYPREANGDVAPIRILGGPDTQLSLGRQTDGGGQSPPIRIDPIHNLMIVPSGGKMLIFDRNASGNTKPRATMVGSSGSFAVYAPKQRLIVHDEGNIEIWNIPNSGEAKAPFLKIPAPMEARATDGIMALDPAHKEVIIATAAGNTIVTFSIPEAFD
jgi:hypothetical protein